ncbi:anaphase-promoting complex subunit 11 RING-H2 finger-domain-containing protein [Xylariaceae sp. FL0594]|nr:anaphase-promoting complex subunit 11 RING-H2 finger-domain-containing protein [Xylariaceae sp. FL0594]
MQQLNENNSIKPWFCHSGRHAAPVTLDTSLILPFTLLPYKAAIRAMKVNIKSWNAVASWRWDLPEDDVCGICQVHFDGTCPTCKYPGDDCGLLSGKCGHNFHMHCIMEWIKQESAKGQCPMCRQKFEWTEPIALQQQDLEQQPTVQQDV